MKFVSPGRTVIVLFLSIGCFLADAPAALTTFYSDSFDRSGPLSGSTPDLTTNGNQWTNVYSGFTGGAWETNGAVAIMDNPSTHFGGAFLAVNGTSGVMLDGTADFTFELTLTQLAAQTPPPAGSDTSFGLTDLANPVDLGGDLSTKWLTGMTLNSQGNAFAMKPGSAYQNPTSVGIGNPTTLAISYTAATETLTYYVNGVSIGTATATQAQIASTTYIGMGNNFGDPARAQSTFDNLKLTVDVVPEPTTAVSLLTAVGAILFSRRRAFGERFNR